jgi:hypothetical protein
MMMMMMEYQTSMVSESKQTEAAAGSIRFASAEIQT